MRDINSDSCSPSPPQENPGSASKPDSNAECYPLGELGKHTHLKVPVISSRRIEGDHLVKLRRLPLSELFNSSIRSSIPVQEQVSNKSCTYVILRRKTFPKPSPDEFLLCSSRLPDIAFSWESNENNKFLRPKTVS